MIVVSDTTPLRYLAVLGQLDLLPRLFGAVHCPDAVIRECLHPRAPAPLREWATAPPTWLHIASGVQIDLSLGNTLDAGETEAISLAQILGAHVVLIDERAGRRCAIARGFITAGTLNILAQAGAAGWVDYEEIVSRLKEETNFWFTQEDVDAARKSARPGGA